MMSLVLIEDEVMKKGWVVSCVDRLSFKAFHDAVTMRFVSMMMRSKGFVLSNDVDVMNCCASSSVFVCKRLRMTWPRDFWPSVLCRSW